MTLIASLLAFIGVGYVCMAVINLSFTPWKGSDNATEQD